MYCPTCGKQVPDDSKFCEGCGANLIAPADAAVPAEPQPETVPEPTQPVVEAAPPKPAYTPPPAAPVYAAPPPYAVPQPPVYAPVPPAQYMHPAGAQADDLTKPVGIGGFIGMIVLLFIPLVNFIMLLVWSFSSSVNVNKKNLARAILLLYIIFYVVMIVLMIVFWGVMMENMDSIRDIFSQYDISFQ